jgi:cytochrome b
VFGPEYRRIASFAYSPRDVWEYARGLLLLRPSHHIGHNPAGAAMIYLLFAVLVATTPSRLGQGQVQGQLHGLPCASRTRDL